MGERWPAGVWPGSGTEFVRWSHREYLESRNLGDGIVDSTSARRPRYRDYPHLFWDAKPDAAIDVSSDVVLARLLTRANAHTVGQLVSPAVLHERLDSLDIPAHARTFWRLVLEGVADGTGASSPERK